MTPDLAELRALGALSEIDVHFAAALARLAGERDPRVLLAAALCSQKVQAGHVCLDLPALCREETSIETADGPRAVTWPELSVWLAALRASALVGGADAAVPLYLDDAGRLYLRRYYEHERSLAQSIRDRVAGGDAAIARDALRAGLERLFRAAPQAAAPQPAVPEPASVRRHGRAGAQAATAQLELFAPAAAQEAQPSADSARAEAEPDGQRQAAERAVERAFCVISGGPGTGKTSTVVKILALLAEQSAARGLPPPRMLLLAPTGKAAARLSESIQRAKRDLNAAPDVREAIPHEASTIHRALGTLGGSTLRFRHNRDTPLTADVVVVDEASMVDLALMARLLEAVPAGARVILLGDKDQLASVEAGAVLGDICGAGLSGARHGALADSIALLTRSFRYGSGSGIGSLAAAINAAQADRALAILRDPRVADVTLVEYGDSGVLPQALWSSAIEGFAPLLAAQGAAAKLQALERFALLCAHRRGPHGQLAINKRIEAALRDAGLVPPGGDRYPGRPVIVTENDYQTRLFNGEVGVLLRGPEAETAGAEGRLFACFSGPGGSVREIAAPRLPPHESAYALSVHKSQGSEFDEVAVVLPPQASPVLSRELLYTAVTRARKRVVVYGSAEIVALSIERTVRRASGLRDALWRPSHS